MNILIREAFGTPATVYARYLHGKEQSRSLEDCQPDQIDKIVKQLVKEH